MIYIINVTQNKYLRPRKYNEEYDVGFEKHTPKFLKSITSLIQVINTTTKKPISKAKTLLPKKYINVLDNSEYQICVKTLNLQFRKEQTFFSQRDSEVENSNNPGTFTHVFFSHSSAGHTSPNVSNGYVNIYILCSIL